jgi:hypothetical protein
MSPSDEGVEEVDQEEEEKRRMLLASITDDLDGTDELFFSLFGGDK